MFSKPQNQTPTTPPSSNGVSSAADAPAQAATPARKGTSLICGDLKLEGSITGGAEVQIDGSITGDVRVERVSVGESGHVDGGIFAEAVEVRGRVSGSITAKLVRLYGAAHVEGDITHEQLAIETGAFFQGRSLRLQRPAPQPQISQPAAKTAAPAASPAMPVTRPDLDLPDTRPSHIS
ncbi:MAG TPA: polymer-forming cytoskeletal protein [Caulobacteraceae bacterium]|jgi:cytoskeletal protein CcmA (bactofilin family)|nr:polymer-forming cytoskeletal protein [Caulobacteraceae bacterium]